MRNALRKKVSKPMEKTEVFKNNPKVDLALMEQHKKLNSELRKPGVDTTPKFNIAPPLGGGRLLIFYESG